MKSGGSSRVGPDGVIRRIEWWSAILVAALALFFHLVFLRHAGGLWRDEVNSVNLAATPTLGGMVSASEFDSFPLLWPLLLRGFSLLSTSDAGFRLLGVATGLLVLVVLFVLARRRSDLPILCLALLGVNPQFIRWGDSVRAYSLGIVLLLITFDLVERMGRQPSARSVGLATLTSVASVQCLFHNAILVGAIVAGGVVVALRRGRPGRALLPVGIGAAAAVSLLPYAPIIRRIGTWSILLKGPFTLGILVQKLGLIVSACGSLVCGVWVGSAALALAACALALFRGGDAGEEGSAPRDSALYAGSVLAAAMVAYPVFLLRLSYGTEPWYYLPLVALVALAAETALASLLSGPGARIVRAAVGAIVVAASLMPAWTALQARQTNVDLIATRIAAAARERDLILVNPFYYGVSFERYYNGKAPWTTVPPIESHALHRYDLLKKQMSAPDVMVSIVERMTRTLSSGGRVWVVGGLVSDGDSPRPLPPPPLPEFGWRMGPYLYSWGLTAGVFLRIHAADKYAIAIEEPANQYERLGLFAAQGWRP